MSSVWPGVSLRLDPQPNFSFKPILIPTARDRGGVCAAEAGGAEAAASLCDLQEVLYTKIAQGIHTDDLRDFLHCVVVCNQVFRLVNVRAIVAGGDKGGALTLMWISLAPARRSRSITPRQVVPRTMESSISTMRFPSTSARMGLSLRLTPISRSSWVGEMNVRPMYLFLVKPMP